MDTGVGSMWVKSCRNCIGNFVRSDGTNVRRSKSVSSTGCMRSDVRSRGTGIGETFIVGEDKIGGVGDAVNRSGLRVVGCNCRGDVRVDSSSNVGRSNGVFSGGGMARGVWGRSTGVRETGVIGLDGLTSVGASAGSKLDFTFRNKILC